MKRKRNVLKIIFYCLSALFYIISAVMLFVYETGGNLNRIEMIILSVSTILWSSSFIFLMIKAIRKETARDKRKTRK